MSGSSSCSSAHCFVVYEEHEEVEEAYVVPMGVEPEGQESFVCHCALDEHC